MSRCSARRSRQPNKGNRNRKPGTCHRNQVEPESDEGGSRSPIPHPSSLIIHHPSSSIIPHHPSSLIIHHPSSFIIHHHPSSIIHHPSFLIHHPSFIIHHPSSITPKSKIPLRSYTPLQPHAGSYNIAKDTPILAYDHRCSA